LQKKASEDEIVGDGDLKRPELVRNGAGGKIKVVIDCPEEIPCNPCAEACRKGALVIEGDMSKRPSCRDELCDGCGSCIAACPVSCIILVEEKGEETLLTMGYDRLPRPRKGQEVWLLDREGREMGKGAVARARRAARDKYLLLLTIKAPTQIALEVRNIRVDDRIGTGSLLELGEEEIEESAGLVCRCEEIDESRLLEVMAAGVRHHANLRRMSRAGLGLCQGRMCGELVLDRLAEETGSEPDELGLPRARTPIRPISLGELAGFGGGSHGGS
jgi:sarcosine oxidase subunit alpha